jgi:hypothetical protein
MNRKIAAPLLTLLLLSACKSEVTNATENVAADMEAPALNETAPALSGELAPCPEVGRRLTKQDCDDLTGVANSARAGVAAFNAPDTMVRDKPVVLELAVGLPQPESPPAAPDEMALADEANSAALNETGSNVSEDEDTNVTEANRPRVHHRAYAAKPAKPQTPEDVVGELPGKIVSYSPVVGRFMRATLTGAGFTIKPLSSESQEVFRDSQTVWQWEVTALKPDPHILTLTTVVEGVTQDGKHYPLRSTTRSQSVKIERTVWQKIWDTIDIIPDRLKAITAVIVALTALVTAVIALRKVFGKPREETPPKD